jgi:cholesterol transport system auxiliary component
MNPKIEEARAMAPFTRSLLIASVAAVLLTGCISFGGKTPDSLLTLTTAVEARPANMPRTGTTATALTVLIPNTPQKLRTPRVPVQTGATAIAYVKDAVWVEPPARLFQRMLSETIAARGSRLVLDESQYVTGPGEMLSGELTEFGVDADHMQVVVVYQALRLQRDGNDVIQQRFEARESVSAIEPALVGAALNSAANKVAGDVATWVAGS